MSFIDAIFKPSQPSPGTPPSQNSASNPPAPAPAPQPAPPPQPATEPDTGSSEDIDDGTYQPVTDDGASAGETPAASDGAVPASDEPAAQPVADDGDAIDTGTSPATGNDPAEAATPSEETPAGTDTPPAKEPASETTPPTGGAVPVAQTPYDETTVEEPEVGSGATPTPQPAPASAPLSSWALSLEAARAERDARVGTQNLTPSAGANVTPISTTLTSAIFALVEHDLADITRIAEQTAQNLRLQGILSMLSANSPALQPLLDDRQDDDVTAKLAARSYRQY